MSTRTQIIIAVLLGIVLLDQATKILVAQTIAPYERIPVVPSFFDLTHLRNPGAAFSLFAQAPEWFRQPFFFVVTGIAIVALSVFLHQAKEEGLLLTIAVSGVLAGAIGNLIDRIMYGEVIDFLLVYWGDYHWPAFNVADSCITLGVIGLLWTSFRAPSAPV
ncbi:MAG: signal peptidase II [Deltaproteobacteria bacterium]|jgi:signal peptidase II|nr:signal peptidase II [Deltaproteobacteria bacterium]